MMNPIPTPSPFLVEIPKQNIEYIRTSDTTWIHQIRNYPMFHLLYKKWGGSSLAKEGIVYLQNEILQSLYAQQNYETSSHITISTSTYWSNMMYSGLPSEFSDVVKQIEDIHRCEITEKVFQNTQKLLIDEIISDGDYPEIIMQRLFLFYNTPHKYMTYGRVSQIDTIKLEDIQKNWEICKEEQRSLLFTTSPFSQQILQNSIQKENLRMSHPPSVPLNYSIDKFRSIFVGNRSVEQGHILMVSNICGIHSGSHFYASIIAIHLLGGSFDSRLSRILRIDKGLTYDISMSVQEGHNSSYLFLQTAVEEIRPALDIITKVCKNAEKDWTDQDITKGIFNMKYEYLMSFATGRRSMLQLEERILFEEDIHKIQMEENLSPYENITIEDVRQALQIISHLNWFKIVLGHPSDFKSIKKGYEFVKCKEIDYM